jgi:uncharacterized membrane protein YfcA
MEEIFVALDTLDYLQVLVLGFIGGTLSGFIGTGGAFIMTPGMMNLGVPGIIAVGTNITHKFGKAMVGSRRHNELGHVDKKLGLFMLFTALLGVRFAVWINSLLYGISSDRADGGAMSNLYISLVFVFVLLIVSITILRDVLRKRKGEETGPSKRIADYLSRLRLFPMIDFPAADVKVSLWIIMIVGFASGYLAGTIGVGGFISVPAMIYIFGVPTAVATGTGLYLAMFVGGFGTLNYVFAGFVDIRLVILLYIGSLFGILIGAYGTKTVKEYVIRLVTALIILFCVISRFIAIPIYLTQLNLIDFLDPLYIPMLNTISKSILYVTGTSGTAVIIIFVIKEYLRKNKVYATIIKKT